MASPNVLPGFMSKVLMPSASGNTFGVGYDRNNQKGLFRQSPNMCNAERAAVLLGYHFYITGVKFSCKLTSTEKTVRSNDHNISRKPFSYLFINNCVLGNKIHNFSLLWMAASKKQIYVSSMNNRETKCRGRVLCRHNRELAKNCFILVCNLQFKDRSYWALD
jgi:hypothetical protein